MGNRYKNRRFTAAGWVANPFLAQGEIGVVLDGDGIPTSFRVGDGTSFATSPEFAVLDLGAYITSVALDSVLDAYATNASLGAYATVSAVNSALGAYATTSALNTALSGYATAGALATGLSGKQNALASGANIKTLNGESILGAGNIVVSGGGGGSSVPAQTAETDVIPLDTPPPGKSIPFLLGTTISVTTVRNITIAAGAVQRGECEVFYTIRAGGVLNMPTSSPFAGGSVVQSGDTIEEGYRYRIVFGISANDLLIIVFRQAAVDVLAPTLLSATVSNANPDRVNLVFSEGMNATWSAFSAFAAAGHTGSGITRLTATTGYFTVTVAFVNGEPTRAFTYSQPGTNRMQDLAGNLLENLTLPITNNVVPVSGAEVKLRAAASVGSPLETGDNINGWNYFDQQDLNIFDPAATRIVFDKSRPAAGDAFFTVTTDAFPVLDNQFWGPFIGLDQSNTATTFNLWKYGFGIKGDDGLYIQTDDNAGGGTVLVSRSALPNDQMRFKITSNLVTAQVSSDGAVTWGDVVSWSVPNANQLYFHAQLRRDDNTTDNVANIRGAGVV